MISSTLLYNGFRLRNCIEQLVDRHGRAEIVTLQDVTAEIAQSRRRLRTFDTFGHDDQIEPVGEVGDCAHHQGGTPIN